MYMMRKWAISHAKSYNKLYEVLEKSLIKLYPLLTKVGYDRVEKPITFIEKNIKGFLFDCQMCGQCVLHDTGMSCPMNCPKELRNGPCGGVRPNGHCEVKPDMRCVWMEAWRGNKIIDEKTDISHSILKFQPPIDHQLKGSSSWLKEVRIKRDKQFLKGDAL